MGMTMNYKKVATWEEYEIAEKNGISRHNVDQRLAMGWDLTKATTEPIANSFKRKHKKYVDLAEKNGIKYPTFYNRVNVYKWSLQEAATTPIMTREDAWEKSRRLRSKIPDEIYVLAEKNGIAKNTLQSRVLVLKWDMKTAATLKASKGNRTKKGEAS